MPPDPAQSAAQTMSTEQQIEHLNKAVGILTRPFYKNWKFYLGAAAVVGTSVGVSVVTVKVMRPKAK